ncbi:hypothetical protein PR202_ga13641 [Eleusine coracana subsp. coracana]|uniref:Uncharacterized protein n=1 Tax=Eleusine coracana subsp. coracana TaxID=191504 RepID=A0AAV5CEK1_ELECO|nr:hypothetical protein PR202_ga13641 [Eleusine coracana subsp. coracana]
MPRKPCPWQQRRGGGARKVLDYLGGLLGALPISAVRFRSSPEEASELTTGNAGARGRCRCVEPSLTCPPPRAVGPAVQWRRERVGWWNLTGHSSAVAAVPSASSSSH